MMFLTVYINLNGYFVVLYLIGLIDILRKGIKSTFGMIKNIFTSPKKTKREKEKNSNKSKETNEQNSNEDGRQKLSENTNNNIKETKRYLTKKLFY